jgi:M6 family metalloprotease-like protein
LPERRLTYKHLSAILWAQNIRISNKGFSINIMRFSSIASSLVVALCCASGVTAAPANPNGHVYTQPDGSATPTLFLNGNQHYAWMSDAKGYTVVKDEQGWYVYGKKEEGDIISAGVRVGHSNPKKLGLIPQLQHDVELRRGLVHEHEEAEHRNLIAVPEKALCNFNGSKNSPCRLKGLVVLIKFASHGSRVLPSSSEYDTLFNNNGPTTNNIAPTGSVADVYLENSYDTFVLESVVSDWVTLTKTEAQAVDGDLGLNKPGTKAAWSEALTLAKKQFGNSYKQFDGDGDGAFDCLVMMHSGTASETGGIDVETAGDHKTRIWSHATTSEWYKDNEIKVGRFYVASGIWDIAPPGGKGTKWDLARIAVIAHECAHFLGLPDLYDTTGGSGAGTFDLLGK